MDRRPLKSARERLAKAQGTREHQGKTPGVAQSLAGTKLEAHGGGPCDRPEPSVILTSTPILEPEAFFGVVAAGLEARRTFAKGHLTVSFMVVEDGPWHVDSRRSPAVQRKFDDDADLCVVCNRRALSDLLLGQLDAGAPKPGQLFLWAGQPTGWQTLSQAFAHTKSAFEARLDALR